MPMPMANSWSSLVLLNTRGTATTRSVRRIAPVTDVSPPTTATESPRIDCGGVK